MRAGRACGAHFPGGLRERAAPSTIRGPRQRNRFDERAPGRDERVPGGKGATGKTGSVTARIAVAKTEATRIGAARFAAGRSERAANGAGVSGARAKSVRRWMRRGRRRDESRLVPAGRFRLSPNPPRVPPPGVCLRIGRGREGRAARKTGRSARANARRIGAAERRLPRNGNPPAARGVPTRRSPGRGTGPRKRRRRPVQRKPNALATRKALPARRWTAFFPRGGRLPHRGRRMDSRRTRSRERAGSP